MMYQVVMNGTRLGSYPFFQQVFGVDKSSSASPSGDRFFRNVAAGAVAGAVGATLASPLYLVKTRLQSQSSGSSASKVGYQHAYRGTLDGFLHIMRTEGATGLFRGLTAAIPRVMVGGSTQLATYDTFKSTLVTEAHMDGTSPLTHLSASLMSGFCVAMTMTPFDVIATRLYNQPAGSDGRGLMYRNMLDCVGKIARTEGLAAFYKGFWALYLRLGPHTVS
jgi:solute carrier family 25, member 34/35